MQHAPIPPMLLFAEAAVLGLPATLFFAGASPVALIALYAALVSPSFEGTWLAAQLLCSGYALFQYWRVAIKTVRGEKIPFGPSIWAAAICGFVAAFFLATWASPLAALAAVLPAVGALHFLAIQHTKLKSRAALQ